MAARTVPRRELLYASSPNALSAVATRALFAVVPASPQTPAELPKLSPVALSVPPTPTTPAPVGLWVAPSAPKTAPDVPRAVPRMAYAPLAFDFEIPRIAPVALVPP